MHIELEIQTTTKKGYERLRRPVELAELPLPGDWIDVEFFADGVRVRGRHFGFDGTVVLDLGWHRFDDAKYGLLAAQGWSLPRRLEFT